jgi:hypothetical protein
VHYYLLNWTGSPEVPPVFSDDRVTRSLVLCLCCVDRCLSFWPLRCLSPFLFTYSDFTFGIFKLFYITNYTIVNLASRNYCQIEKGSTNDGELSRFVLAYESNSIKTNESRLAFCDKIRHILGNTICNSGKSDVINVFQTLGFSMYYMYIILGFWMCKSNLIYLWTGSTWLETQAAE